MISLNVELVRDEQYFHHTDKTVAHNIKSIDKVKCREIMSKRRDLSTYFFVFNSLFNCKFISFHF